MEEEKIKETISQQLQLLADRSQTFDTWQNLEEISQTMLELAKWLYTIQEKSSRHQSILESYLISNLGESKLKKIGEQIASILQENNLHNSPRLCMGLFHYMESVVRDWNEL